MTDILKQMNYNHLLSFTALVEEGGLAPAARRLGLSHPTISEQVKRLEESLELQLFERRGRRLHLTDDGELVYGYSQQIFGMGRAMAEALESHRTGSSVLVRVGVDSVLPKLGVRRALNPAFESHGDHLQVRVVEGDTSTLMDQLKARHIDMVLTDSPQSPTKELTTSSHMVMDSGLSFFGTPELQTRIGGSFPANLDGAPVLLPLPTTRLRGELARWFSSHDVSPRVAGEIEDSGLIKAFGQVGRGVFVMPSHIEDDVVTQYGVVVLGRTDDVRAQMFAVTRGRLPSNAGLASVLERIKRHAEAA